MNTPTPPPDKPQGAELSAEPIAQTPRTDAFLEPYRKYGEVPHALIDFARQLERELTAKTSELTAATEALEKAKAELAALRPMSREEMQAQLDKANYGDKLTEQMRTHLGCEVSHDMRCDHEGDSLNRVRWNSRAIILLLCALYDQEEAAKTEREQSGKREAALREAGNKLRQSAEMLGYVQDAQCYRDSLRNIADWDAALSQQAPTNDTQG
jgi:hypothetical protein